MHREGGAPVQLGLVDLLGEEALAAGLDQRAILDPVTGRDQSEDREVSVDRRAGQPALRSQPGLHVASLYQGQRRAAGRDGERF